MTFGLKSQLFRENFLKIVKKNIGRGGQDLKLLEYVCLFWWAFSPPLLCVRASEDTICRSTETPEVRRLHVFRDLLFPHLCPIVAGPSCTSPTRLYAVPRQVQWKCSILLFACSHVYFTLGSFPICIFCTEVLFPIHRYLSSWIKTQSARPRRFWISLFSNHFNRDGATGIIENKYCKY